LFLFFFYFFCFSVGGGWEGQLSAFVKRWLGYLKRRDRRAPELWHSLPDEEGSSLSRCRIERMKTSHSL
jgi:hypothetical protein